MPSQTTNYRTYAEVAAELDVAESQVEDWARGCPELVQPPYDVQKLQDWLSGNSIKLIEHQLLKTRLRETRRQPLYRKYNLILSLVGVVIAFSVGLTGWIFSARDARDARAEANRARQEVQELKYERTQLEFEAHEARHQLSETLRRVRMVYDGGVHRLERFHAQPRVIVVGSKDFTEQHILCELIAQLIEDEYPDVRVKRRFDKPTWDNFNALRLGIIDVYVEYTGTLVKVLLKDGDPDRIRSLNGLLGKQELKLGEKLGFHNSYVLVMRRDKALELGRKYLEPPRPIQLITDLVDVSRNNETLVFRGTDEFQTRPDGIRALKSHYKGLRFGTEDIVDEPKRLSELCSERMDVTTAFATDPQLASDHGTCDIVSLTDDLKFFPKYWAAPLAHQDLLIEFSRISDVLHRLDGVIDKQTMIRLIAQFEGQLASRFGTDQFDAASEDQCDVLVQLVRDFISSDLQPSNQR